MAAVSALVRYSSVEAVLSTHDALYEALGSTFTLCVAGRESESDQLISLAEYLSPRLEISVGDAESDVAQRLNSRGNPIVLLPVGGLRSVVGIHSALELLDKTPDMAAVCGFTFDSMGRPGPGAYAPPLPEGAPREVLAEIAQTEQRWRALDRCAVTTCVGPTPLAVVRSGSLTASMCMDLSLSGMALANLFTAQGSLAHSSILFSGLACVTEQPQNPRSPATGEVEVLSADAYEAWLATGVEQVTVLHTSRAIRDDHQRRIVHVGDRTVRAIDSTLISQAADPTLTLLSPAYARQLGPGFQHIADMASRPTSPEVSPEHWGSYEVRVLALAKKVDQVLPHTLREFARRRLRDPR